MIRAGIIFAFSNFPLTFLIIGFIAAALSLSLGSRRITARSVREKVFAYFLLFPVALSFFYNFVMHVFFGAMSAHFIGWQNSPFQAEVGFASLGFAFVAMLAFHGSHGLRIGAVVGPSFFLLGAAAGHVHQIVIAHNFAPGNAGVMLYMDCLIPLIGLILLWLEHRDISASIGSKSYAAV